MRSARTSRVLALVMCASLGLQGTAQVRPEAFSVNVVLAEALKAAPEANTADRARVLIALHPALRRFEPERADALLYQAADLAETLSDGDSLLAVVLKSAVQGAFAGAASVLLAWPYWLAPAFPVPGTGIDAAGDARAFKAAVSLNVVDALAPLNASRALKLAASIDVPIARARGFNNALAAAHGYESTTLSNDVREQAAIAEKQRQPVVIAGLALGVVSRDAPLGAELAQRALKLLTNPSTDFQTADATYVYRAVGALDSRAAERELERLVGLSNANEDALLAFAAGTAEPQPLLAWRALNAATRPGDTNKTRLMKLAAILRQLPDRLPAELHDAAMSYATDLLARAAERPGPFIFNTVPTEGVVAALDTVTFVAALDPRGAREQVDHVRFHRMVGTQILLQVRNGRLRDRFPTDLLRLELALLLLTSRPHDAFSILETLDQPFWEGLAKSVFRYPRSPTVRASSLTLRMSDQLHRVRREWPAAARKVCLEEAGACGRTLQRFQQVATWLDAEAVDRVADDGDRRSLWVDYLPLASALAADALAAYDPQAADQAIREGLKVALKLPTPSREWALAWNAAMWNSNRSDAAKAAVADSLKRIEGLQRRGVGKSWWEWTPRFIEQVARVDPSLAYALARENDAALRPMTLAAVVSATSGSVDAK